MWCDHSTKIQIYNSTHPEGRITTLTAHAAHTVIHFTPIAPYLRGVTLLSGENGAGGRTDVFTIHKWAAQWPAKRPLYCPHMDLTWIHLPYLPIFPIHAFFPCHYTPARHHRRETACLHDTCQMLTQRLTRQAPHDTLPSPVYSF